MSGPTWEDFLSSYDKGQSDVKLNWGPKPPPASSRSEGRQKQRRNQDKFVGNMGKPTAKKIIDPKDLERIRKLEALASNAGAAASEKAKALELIAKIKNK